MIDFLVALTVPLMLMVAVTRVTFHLIGAVIVTFMILFFAFSLHEKPWYIIALSLFSMVIGWSLAKKVLKKKPGM